MSSQAGRGGVRGWVAAVAAAGLFVVIAVGYLLTRPSTPPETRREALAAAGASSAAGAGAPSTSSSDRTGQPAQAGALPSSVSLGVADPTQAAGPEAASRSAAGPLAATALARSESEQLAEIRRRLATDPGGLTRREIDTLREIGSREAFELLEEALAAPGLPPKLKAEVVEALAEMPTEGPAVAEERPPTREEIIAALREALGDPNPDVVEDAVYELEMLGGPDAAQAIAGALGRSPSEDTELIIVDALDSLEEPTTLDALESALHASDNSEVSQRIVETLEDFEGPQVVDALGRLLTQSDDAEVKKRAIEALTLIEEQGTAYALSQGLNDPDPEVRDAIADGLYHSDDRDAGVLASLYQAWRNEPDDTVRASILDAIESLEDDLAPEAYRP